MEHYESLHHTKWECKYHVVWIPNRAESSLRTTSEGTGANPSRIGEAKGERGNGGDAKGRSRAHGALHPAEVLGIASGWVCERQERDLGCQGNGKQAEFCRTELLGPRLCVSTVGLDEETIRAYVRTQEEADKKLEQLKIFE